MEEAAAKAGTQVDRGEWRVVMPFYLAETRDQAIADVAEGYRRRAYFGDGPPLGSGATPLTVRGLPPATIEEAIAQGTAIVGTPEDAIAAIERIQELSGGLGGLLCSHHEWATTEQLQHSFELWARFVAPHFRGQMAALHSDRDWFAEKRGEFFGDMANVMVKAYEDAGQAVPAVLRQPPPPQA
jgi:limonene 1,2-monooxygenase